MSDTATPTTALPADLDEIDGGFLTRSLSASHPGTVVSACEILDLRQGSASSLRLGLDYRQNPAELPSTMFLKGDFIDHEFTSPVAFAAEANFFARLADSVGRDVRIPSGYFGGIDEDGQAIVLLEDLTRRDVTFGEATRPWDVDLVATGIEQLARLHVTHWGGRGLEGQDWLEETSGVEMLMRYLVQPDHFDDYIDRPRAAAIPDELRDRAGVERALIGMFETDSALPTTLIHGDAHIGNTWAEDGVIGFFDWQGVSSGPYIWDTTYFLTGALTVEDRRANERELLGLYHQVLVASLGDDAPPMDDLWLGHRRHLMHGFLTILTPDQMQPDEFAVAIGDRFAQAAVDLETLSAF